jgi:sphinganine-1-phosphate aldolase
MNNIKKYTILLGFLYLLYKKHKFLIYLIFSNTPKGKKYIKDKKKEALNIIQKSVFNQKWAHNFSSMDYNGLSIENIKDIISDRKRKLNNKISGTIYNNKKSNIELASYIYNLYLYSNPLHSDLFPELNKMESEVIKMVGKLFNLPSSGGGNITTGGTESTICAIKAYKKYKIENSYFPYYKLEVLTTKTGHAAINKACELLDLKLIYVNLNKDYTMDLDDLKRKISYKTCVVIGSAPCFPYGLMDPIKEIGSICKNNNVPFHVDACLGGFITQFNNELKLSFKDNIDSISVDPHKFGYAPKGSSLLLWKSKKIKHHQYFITSDWCGGIYASCSLPGSRVGNQIATTWGILLHNGLNFYKTTANKILRATKSVKDQINSIPSFEVIGNPNVNVVAFRSSKYNLSTIIDSFEKKKWNLNILQNPLCLHICITPANIGNLNEFISILKKINNADIIENDGLVAIYGLATKISNKKLVNEIIYDYLDITTDN